MADAARPLIYDMNRLYMCVGWWQFRGVDRTDLAVAEELFRSWPGEILGSIMTPWGTRLFPRHLMLDLIQDRRAIHREDARADEDQALAAARALLAGAPTAPPAPEPGLRPIVGSMLEMVWRTGIYLGSPPRRAPPGAAYLNVGQLTWAFPWIVRWLRRRPDIRAMFMVHDAIPQARPDLSSAGLAAKHDAFFDAIQDRAAAILTSTRAATAEIQSVLAARGGRQVPARIAPWPVEPAFLDRPAPDPELAAAGYFVVVGGFEARKNHALLLDAWDRIRARRGAATPRLVAAGPPPGAGDRALMDALRARSGPGGDVVLAIRPSTQALRQLVANARALLMPSLAEGYGLPVVEALAMGTPVIASDIPPHAEIAQGCADLSPLGDADGWAARIEALAFDPSALAAARARAAAFRPVTRAAYFERLRRILLDL